jgi:hypothetical protein
MLGSKSSKTASPVRPGKRRLRNSDESESVGNDVSINTVNGMFTVKSLGEEG